MKTVKFECNADNYRDLVEVEVSYKWLQSKVGNVEVYIENALYSENDDIFELASKENQVISFREIKITEE